ncbi:MAG: energy transducer TonB, partial [Polyangiaceae bacterium]
KVLTAEPRPDEPVDLTSTFVQGTGDLYAGGVTSATGTGKTAVGSLVAAAPIPRATAPLPIAPVVEAPDRSRTASLSGGTDWSCPFPPEADATQIDDAYVTLQVDVDDAGRAASVSVVADPGNGFGREARRCAMSRRYSTALDREGDPVAGRTRPFRVHFSR